MHHFFITKENIIASEIVFPAREFLHITRVLRIRPGELVTVSDGQYFYKVEITLVNDEEVRGLIKDKEVNASESPLHTILVQGIAKGDKMDLIVQKATELGINEIIPIDTTYCVVKLDSKKKLDRQDRWQKIAHEAAKQSKRLAVPKIHAPLAFKEAFTALPIETVKIILWESEHGYGFKEFFKTSQSIASMALFIGPEGGFSEEEVTLAREHGTKSVTLGNRILRSETAGIAALSVVQYALGDLGGKFSAR